MRAPLSGSLRKFPRRLSQFPFSFLADPRWVPAPPVTFALSPSPLGEKGKDPASRRRGIVYAALGRGGRKLSMCQEVEGQGVRLAVEVLEQGVFENLVVGGCGHEQGHAGPEF